MRALGFCVSVEHARFMARLFQEAGVASVAVWADSPEDERAGAIADLAARRINVLSFSCSTLKGHDYPRGHAVASPDGSDAVPAATWAGLRRLVGKTVCTVLDFVGHHQGFGSIGGFGRYSESRRI
jgi:hypothetical protein